MTTWNHLEAPILKVHIVHRQQEGQVIDSSSMCIRSLRVQSTRVPGLSPQSDPAYVASI